MRRREFITGILLAAVPERLQAQTVYHLALVEASPSVEVSEGFSWSRALVEELRRLGYVEGRTLRIDQVYAGGHGNKQIDEMARDVVRLNPDLIVTMATPSTLAFQKQTTTIPIVCLTLTDPVSTGLVSSETKPGGNITGFTDYEYSIGGKWVELLKEISPATTRLALPFNEATAPYAKKFIRPAEAAARRLSVSLVVVRLSQKVAGGDPSCWLS